MTPVAEIVYYQDSKTLVTSTRVVANGTLYPVANITSARIAANYAPAVACFVIAGVFCLFFHMAGATNFLSLYVLPGLLAATGVYYFARPSYNFLLVTASSEARVLQYIPRSTAVGILDAVSKAIVQRG